MKYSRTDIIDALRAVGLMAGDDVFIHSNLGFFGLCEGVKDAESFSQVFFEAFVEVIGPDGTLIVPTFTYSGCKGEIYDPLTTPCAMGIFSDYVMNRKDSVRSADPNFSVAAVGKSAVFYTENAPANSYDQSGFFGRLLERNAAICCLNFDAGTTFVHFVERMINVPYRYDKKFVSPVIIDGETKTYESYHFVYSYDHPENAACFERLNEIAIASGVAKTTGLGRGQVLLERAGDLKVLIENTIKRRPRFLLKEEAL